MIKLRGLLDVVSEANLASAVRMYQNVHLRFRLAQVTLHLLGSESPLFEPLFEGKFKKRTLITMIKLRGLLDVVSEANLASAVRMYQNVHLRFRLAQITLHLLGSEGSLFEHEIIGTFTT